VQVHRERKSIQRAGAELVLVGMGELRYAQAFQRELDLSCPILVDPSRVAYKALSMKRGVGRTVAMPSVWAARLRASREGFRQRGIKGDPWQLGGVLVVLPGGRVAYRYLSDTSADHPPVTEVLSALEDAGA
jgi:hypothetical protein